MDNTTDDAIKYPVNDSQRRILERLHMLKQLKSVSYNKIAKACNCTASYIFRIYQGKYMPNETVKYELAVYFKVNPLELWNERNERPEQNSKRNEDSSVSRRIGDVEEVKEE